MNCSIFSRRLALLALGIAFALPSVASADEALDALHMSVLKSTGMVLTPNSSGSAFLIDAKEKLLLTHYHVVRGQTDISVVFPWYQEGKLITDTKFYVDKGEPTKATVLAANRRYGLALLKVEKVPDSLVAIPLASEETAEGETLYAVGFNFVKGIPFEMTQHKVTRMSHSGQFLQGLGIIAGQTIHLDVPFQPGNGGAPVVNDAGELVGVSIGGVTPETTGILLDGRDAKKFVIEWAQANQAAPVKEEAASAANAEETPAQAETEAEAGSEAPANEEEMSSNEQ